MPETTHSYLNCDSHLIVQFLLGDQTEWRKNETIPTNSCCKVGLLKTHSFI